MKTTLEIAQEYNLNGQLFEEFVLHKKLPHTRNANGEMCISAEDTESHVALYEKALGEAAKRQAKRNAEANRLEGALRIIGVLCMAAAVIYSLAAGIDGLLIIGLPAVVFATVLFAVAEILARQREIIANQHEILKKLK